MADKGSTSRHNYDHISKMKRRPEGVDFISCLPDEVLQQILLFVPTKFAIRTSVLSKRWKKIWCEAPSISFDVPRLSADSIIKIIMCHTAKKIINFHLTICTIVTAAQIDSLVEFIMSRNTENISLEFTMEGGYSFPDIFYSNSFVENLKLDLWRGPRSPSCNVSWKSLKNLSLHFCHVSDESIARIVSGAPVLESLTLSFYVGLGVLDLTNALRLSRLDLHAKISRKESIQITAPHIHYLRLRNSRSSETPFTLKDVSSLDEADLDVGSDSGETSMVDFRKMIEMLQNIKKLTLGTNFLQILSYALLHGIFFRADNLEALTVEITIFESIYTGIKLMLQTSPRLKKINVHLTDTSVVPSVCLFTHFKQRGLKPDETWKMKGPAFLGAEVKFVLYLVKYLIGNANSVETIVVWLGASVNASGYDQLLQMVPPLSRKKKVSIVLNWGLMYE